VTNPHLTACHKLQPVLPFIVWFLVEEIYLEYIYAEAMLNTRVRAPVAKLYGKMHHTEKCEVSPYVNP